MKRLLSSALLVAALLPLSSFAATYTFSVTGGTTGTTNSSYLLDIPHGYATTWGLSGTNYTSLFNDINTGGKIVTSATLTLTNIYDWTGEGTDPKDALFINILAGLNTGLSTKQFASGTAPSNDWALAVNPFVDSPSTTGDWNDVLQSSLTYTGAAGSALPFTDATSYSLLKASAADTVSGTPAGVTWSDPTGGVSSTLVITFSGDNLLALTALLDADTSTGAPNVGLGFAAECHYYMSGATLSVTTSATVPDSGSTIALMGMGVLALAGFRRFKK